MFPILVYFVFKKKNFFNGFVVYNDNLEIVTCGIEELLNERWVSFDGALIQSIFDILIEHLKQQYNLGLVGSVGADIRARIFESLLLLQCRPFTQQLGRNF